MQHPFVERCLRRRRHRHEAHGQNDIPAHPMVLVDTLGVIHAPEHFGGIVLRYPHDGLQEEEDVGDKAEDGVRGLEVRPAVADLVVFDYHQGGQEGEDGGCVQGGVDVGALPFLLGRVGRLEDEDGLGG